MHLNKFKCLGTFLEYVHLLPLNPSTPQSGANIALFTLHVFTCYLCNSRKLLNYAAVLADTRLKLYSEYCD